MLFISQCGKIRKIKSGIINIHYKKNVQHYSQNYKSQEAKIQNTVSGIISPNTLVTNIKRRYHTYAFLIVHKKCVLTLSNRSKIYFTKQTKKEIKENLDKKYKED